MRLWMGVGARVWDMALCVSICVCMHVCTVNFLIAATLYFAAAWLEIAPSAEF